MDIVTIINQNSLIFITIQENNQYEKIYLYRNPN